MSILDKFEIDLAIRQERYYRDTAQWEALRSMWHPDDSKTLVDISWINSSVNEWIDASKEMHSLGIGPIHLMQPAEILVKDNRATAVSTQVIRVRTSYQGCDMDLESWTYQHQRFEKVDGAWKITRFQVIYIRDSVSTAFPGQDVPLMDDEGMEVVRNARAPFKYVAWQMSLIGGKVRNDLPAYDDEKTWKPIVEGNKRWLETGTH